MVNSNLLEMLGTREASVTPDNILENSKAGSGGERDLNFLRYLLGNDLLILSETVLKRTGLNFTEEYYLERYRKISFETDRHFLCRTIIQDELYRLGIKTMNDTSVGHMDILRSSSSYDIVAGDLSVLIDVGLAPARNYFRGLTDLKVKNYLITTYFDDYMDDIIFSVFSRGNDQYFLDAVKDYEDGFNILFPNPAGSFGETGHYSKPGLKE